MMNMVNAIRLPNQALMYAANPYKTHIGKIYLFVDDLMVHRCLIKDVYCDFRSRRLELKADFQYLDKGGFRRGADFSNIFDFPQIISHYAEIEPEANIARLDLGTCELFYDGEINQYFIKLVEGYRGQKFNVKILDYQAGEFYIDLITSDRPSVIQDIRDKFQVKIERYEERAAKSSFYEVPNHGRNTRCNRGPSNNIAANFERPYNQLNPIDNYYKVAQNALQYFKRKLYHTRDSSIRSHTGRQLCSVRVLSWLDPESFVIMPDDEGYVQGHDEFKRRLGALECIKNAEQDQFKSDRIFEPNEYILFRNFADKSLGPWLRGVVMSLSRYNHHGLSVGTHTTRMGHDNIAEITRMVNAGLLDKEDIIYRVRSIDYGYQCVVSPLNMRHVRDETEYRKIGTWSMRCCLFGIFPLASEMDKYGVGLFSPACNDMVDCWIRERLAADNHCLNFYVLFRTNLLPCDEKLFDKPIEISLFHKRAPSYYLHKSLAPVGPTKSRGAKFDCLNWYLVDRGFASDQMYKMKVNSNIQLDEYVINMLAEYDKL